MAANDYHFVTRWRVRGDIEEAFALLGDAPGLKRWWPAVYLQVEQLDPGDATTGIGKVADLHTKGWLPYTLRWRFRVTESNMPYGFSLEASGDFDGRGVWTLKQDGEYVDIVYDWRIRAEKPLLHYGSALIKPIFAANHHWAMARGEESLELELRRRHAASAAARAAIPPPPPPTNDRYFWLATAGVAAAVVLGAIRFSRRG